MGMKKFITIFSLIAVSIYWMGCSKTNRPTPEMTIMGDGPSPETSTVPPAYSTDTAGGENLSDFGAEGDLPARDASFIGGGDQNVHSSIYFDFDRSYIRESERSILDETAEYLLQNPGQKVLVEGHCDWHGTSEYNLALGDRRSSAVKTYLVESGVAAATIEVLSKGDLEAVESADDAGRQRDRRADVILIP